MWRIFRGLAAGDRRCCVRRILRSVVRGRLCAGTVICVASFVPAQSVLCKALLLRKILAGIKFGVSAALRYLCS